MFCFLQVPSKRSHNFSTFGAILSLTTLCTRKNSLEIGLFSHFQQCRWYFNCLLDCTPIYERSLLERTLMLDFWKNQHLLKEISQTKLRKGERKKKMLIVQANQGVKQGHLRWSDLHLMWKLIHQELLPSKICQHILFRRMNLLMFS